MKVSELIEQLKLIPDQEIPDCDEFEWFLSKNSPPSVPKSVIELIEEEIHDFIKRYGREPDGVVLGHRIYQELMCAFSWPDLGSNQIEGLRLIQILGYNMEKDIKHQFEENEIRPYWMVSYYA
jgi:hypothetical protein